mgnify:CR=1 FL=1
MRDEDVVKVFEKAHEYENEIDQEACESCGWTSTRYYEEWDMHLCSACNVQDALSDRAWELEHPRCDGD